MMTTTHRLITTYRCVLRAVTAATGSPPYRSQRTAARSAGQRRDPPEPTTVPRRPSPGGQADAESPCRRHVGPHASVQRRRGEAGPDSQSIDVYHCHRNRSSTPGSPATGGAMARARDRRRGVPPAPSVPAPFSPLGVRVERRARVSPTPPYARTIDRHLSWSSSPPCATTLDRTDDRDRPIRRANNASGSHMSTASDGADTLYALPPKAFTAARDERVAAARNAGDRTLATELGALKRPTVGAWLVNLVALRRPDTVESLVDLGQAIRDAQGVVSAAELRELSNRRRAELDAAIALVRATRHRGWRDRDAGPTVRGRGHSRRRDGRSRGGRPGSRRPAAETLDLQRFWRRRVRRFRARHRCGPARRRPGGPVGRVPRVHVGAVPRSSDRARRGRRRGGGRPGAGRGAARVDGGPATGGRRDGRPGRGRRRGTGPAPAGRGPVQPDRGALRATRPGEPRGAHRATGPPGRRTRPRLRRASAGPGQSDH